MERSRGKRRSTEKMFSSDYSFKGLVTELPHLDPQCSLSLVYSRLGQMGWLEEGLAKGRGTQRSKGGSGRGSGRACIGFILFFIQPAG